MILVTGGTGYTGCLLARRLAEAGTAVINIYFNTPKTGPEFTNWDDHPGNAGRPGHFAKYMRIRLPYMDQALAALIEDIFARGLEQRILVVVVGEFGRTPKMLRFAEQQLRSGSLAGCLHRVAFGRRLAHGTGGRRDQSQGGVPDRESSHAAGPASHNLPASGHRL